MALLAAASFPSLVDQIVTPLPHALWTPVVPWWQLQLARSPATSGGMAIPCGGCSPATTRRPSPCRRIPGGGGFEQARADDDW